MLNRSQDEQTVPPALFALALAAFGVGTSEFAIMGMLPDVARGVEVSIPAAGWLITGYALGVIVGAPLLTVVSLRLRRRTTMLIIVALLAVGSIASALAPNYPMLLAARVLAGVPQGALFGVGAVIAAELVGPKRRTAAMSIILSGFTLATVIGVPASTLVGQHAGWRAPFWSIGALGLLAAAAIAVLLPPLPRPHHTGLGPELAVLRHPRVWLAMAVTTTGFGGVFASFTYITPMMTELAGYAPATMTALLALFGLGMTVGNLLAGRSTSVALSTRLLFFLAGLTIVLFAFTMTAHDKPLAAVTLFLIGMFGFATVPLLQMRILDEAATAPTLASTLNMSAFNIANALGAFLGGLAINSGCGYAAPNAVGGGMSGLGLGLAALSVFAARRL